MLEELLVNNYDLQNDEWLHENLTYLDYLKLHQATDQTAETAVVQSNVAYRNEGNLFRLFSEMGIEPRLFVYMMYYNGYTTPLEYDGKRTLFFVPIEPPIPES